MLKKLWSLLQWAVFSFAAFGMFAISLVSKDGDLNRFATKRCMKKQMKFCRGLA